MNDSEVKDLLRRVFQNDKTFYSYSGKNATNRDGRAPAKGRRFLAPSEMAIAFARKHFDDIEFLWDVPAEGGGEE